MLTLIELEDDMKKKIVKKTSVKRTTKTTKGNAPLNTKKRNAKK